MELVLANRRVRGLVGAWSLSQRYTGPLPDVRLMDIDSAAATQIIKFDGKLESVAYLQYELTALGYRLSARLARLRRPPSKPWSSARAGGAICCRRWCSAPDTWTVSRSIRSSSTTSCSARFGSTREPCTTARGFDRRGGRPQLRAAISRRYDIIQASLVDTWAATAAGAYALSENSLYTVEAFEDYLEHLSDRGVLSVSRWLFDGLRLISLAQETGARHGWNPADRLAIIQHDKVATFLLKKTPFTPAETRLLADAAAELGFIVMYLPGHPVPTFGDSRDQYSRLLLSPDRQRFYRDFPLDVAPTTDDRPFFFHTTRLRNHWSIAPLLRLFGADVERPDNPGSWGTGGLTALLMLVAISSFLIVLFIVAPLALTSKAGLGPGWPRALGYFACLGGAFMLIEVALLQRFVLLLGHPVYR